MFKNENLGKILFGVLLAITGFFSAQTYLSIKNLAASCRGDVVGCRPDGLSSLRQHKR